jgi:superfamily II DNA or RNA helicase
MGSNFITNIGDVELRTRLLELVKNSEEMKFLVGFFYFSGIQELYHGLKHHPNSKLKILVGMKVGILNYQLIEYCDDVKLKSDNDLIEDLINDVRISMVDKSLDNQSFYDQVTFFIQLILDERLIIRKTRQPNHSKIYIFHDEDNVYKKKLFITGSSNLTKSGLTTQAEFNVEISDYGVGETEAYFDDLWEDAVKITENDAVRNDLIRVIEKRTMVRAITPFEAYALTLKTYKDSFDQEKIGPSLIDLLEKNGYTPYQYQLDAVQQALAIIKEHSGVVIADVVGLGKTIIACAVANEIKKRGIVICPPGLMGDRNKKSGWRMYLEQFKLHNWQVRSVGDLESTAEFVQRMKDIEVVIIDEVHRFRNQDTRAYEMLKNICRDKIVIMLTATPLNNRPGDMLSLLKLFITPKKSTITLQNDLVGMFRVYKTTFERLSFIKKNHQSPEADKRAKAQAYYESLFEESEIDLSNVAQRSSYLAAQIRNVIEPVTIRRNRLDLKKNPYYADEVKNLSTVANPIEWFFELTPEQSVLYDRIISTYFGHPDEGGQFKGAIYQPFIYETAKQENLSEKENFEMQQQRNLFDFMRRLMVKRFESSFGAFQQSIKRFRRINCDALTFIEKTGKYIMDRPLLEKIYELEEEQIEDYLANYAEELRKGDYPKNHRIYSLEKFSYASRFVADIKSDLALFDQILCELDEMDLVGDDPKSKCLLDHVDEVLNTTPLAGEPKRKIVIFSEYADTVSHLEKSLKPKYADRLLVVSRNMSNTLIEKINANFDASHQKPANDFDVLLSTDRISEGYNLNRAGMVVNYDIPWNPVRVIQRVGRINRISKKVFEELNIVNFFPTEKGATLVKSREIATNKMFLIHEVLGEDAKIFDIDETPTPAALFNRIRQNPEEMETESFYTKVVNLLLQIEAEHPELVAELDDFPPRVKVAKRGQENELLVMFKKSRLYIQRVSYDADDEETPVTITFEEALPKIACPPDEEKQAFSEAFWDRYQEAKEIREPSQRLGGPQSIEVKAIHNLKTLIKKDYEKLTPYRDFIETLLVDILDYGTLPDFTMRRIANLPTTNASKVDALRIEIGALKQELGENYLNLQKPSGQELKPDIIIAIENQKL